MGIAVKTGLTVSAPGFFAPEGRDTARVKPTIPELDKLLSAYDPRLDGQLVENMEMEASFLTHFLGGIGHWAGAICPAIIKTDFARKLYEDPKTEAAAIARVPMGRLGEPDDLKGLAVFLASPASGYITGQAMTVCGGSYMWT